MTRIASAISIVSTWGLKVSYIRTYSFNLVIKGLFYSYFYVMRDCTGTNQNLFSGSEKPIHSCRTGSQLGDRQIPRRTTTRGLNCGTQLAAKEDVNLWDKLERNLLWMGNNRYLDKVTK